jgi:hypothetical protein
MTALWSEFSRRKLFAQLILGSCSFRESLRDSKSDRGFSGIHQLVYTSLLVQSPWYEPNPFGGDQDHLKIGTFIVEVVKHGINKIKNIGIGCIIN